MEGNSRDTSSCHFAKNNCRLNRTAVFDSSQKVSRRRQARINGDLLEAVAVQKKLRVVEEEPLPFRGGQLWGKTEAMAQKNGKTPHASRSTMFF